MPRSRGVYLFVPFVISDDSGSSPLARGLQEVPVADRTVVGIIPARAGFTHLHEADDQPVQDHPRSRGVYNRDGADESPEAGSSPLARGLRSGRRWLRSLSWIIPARAGFTRRKRTASGCRWDHPRSRGVYADKDKANGSYYGSSPLARGLPRSNVPATPTRGIIPARAGFTEGLHVRRGACRIIPARAGFTPD